MSGSEHARPVWLTREQVEAIDAAALDGQPDLYAIVAAWDAAPADPAEAIEAAIKSAYQYQHSGSSTGPKPKFPEDFETFSYSDRTTEAVLRALGSNT